MLRILFLFILLWNSFSCIAQEKLPLNKLKLPPGFSISIYADNVPNARSMTLGPDGVVFVGTRSAGDVYAVIPNKDRTKAKKVLLIASGLNMPNGVAYHDSALYVAEIHRILRYNNIMQHLSKPPKPQVIVDNLPTNAHHGWRYIKFGPDGWLYVAIGAPCNVCLRKDPRFATIMRMKANGSDEQIYAKGIRNSVGFAWNPGTKVLWFTNNGRDWMGDNTPPDTLNRAPKAGLDFGFPSYHGRVPDPKFAKLRSYKGITPPALNIQAHSATLGMVFYTGKMFPKSYWGQIFIAEHGSWNRSKKVGYRIEVVKLKGSKVISHKPFITGWLQGQTYWGRPVDLLVLPDGSLLISDDYAGVIYRVTYHATVV